MVELFMEGLFLQASLILALGAQNLYVMESGLRKNRPLTVSLVCFLCDLLLIMLGVAGAGPLITQFSFMRVLLGIVGVVFLFVYGVGKILQETTAITPGATVLQKDLKKTIVLAITFSVLNPHAYIDAFVLIGGLSSRYDSLSERLTFGWGAAVCSGLWFLGLSSASSFMRPILTNQKSLKFVMVTSGLVLILLSAKLGRDVYGWLSVDYRTHFSFIP